MTGPHTAAAEITNMTAMIAQDHQSLSADCRSGAGGLLVAFTRRAFGMVLRWSMSDEECKRREQDCYREK